MEQDGKDRGAARTAAQLRMQLAQIAAASQMLARTARDEASREQLAALDQGICRMLRIVGRMELTARLEERPPRLELETLDLARVVRELGEETQSLLALAGRELELRVPQRLLALADRGLVEQLMLELVSNAAAAGRRLTVTLARRGNSAVLTVEDDGPGVPPERLESMFTGGGAQEPVWRQGGGGVALAGRIAQLHGGRLMADQVPGRGLRMAATIPLRLEEAGNTLKSPGLRWDRGGFSPALVELSTVLPAAAFAPEKNVT